MNGLKNLRENWRKVTAGPSTPLPRISCKSSVASANFMRLSLMKAAHVVVSSAARQEIRVRSGRDDNSVCRYHFPASDELSSRLSRPAVEPERSGVEGPAVFVEANEAS